MAPYRKLNSISAITAAIGRDLTFRHSLFHSLFPNVTGYSFKKSPSVCEGSSLRINQLKDYRPWPRSSCLIPGHQHTTDYLTRSLCICLFSTRQNPTVGRGGRDDLCAATALVRPPLFPHQRQRRLAEPSAARGPRPTDLRGPTFVGGGRSSPIVAACVDFPMSMCGRAHKRVHVCKIPAGNFPPTFANFCTFQINPAQDSPST